MDLNLSYEMEGIEAAKEIKLATSSKILLLSSIEEHEKMIHACKKSFASGYVCKNLSGILINTIHMIAGSDNTPTGNFIKELIMNELTIAERHVFNGILEGRVAYSPADRTTANQKTSIFKKLGIKNTRELIHIFNNR